MPYCAAANCCTKKVAKSRKSFHVFPSKPEIAKQWLANMRKENWTPSKGSRLCSDHFEESCFYRFGMRVQLREGSVPTVFNFSKPVKRIRKRESRKGRNVTADTQSLGKEENAVIVMQPLGKDENAMTGRNVLDKEENYINDLQPTKKEGNCVIGIQRSENEELRMALMSEKRLNSKTSTKLLDEQNYNSGSVFKVFTNPISIICEPITTRTSSSEKERSDNSGATFRMFTNPTSSVCEPDIISDPDVVCDPKSFPSTSKEPHITIEHFCDSSSWQLKRQLIHEQKSNAIVKNKLEMALQEVGRLKRKANVLCKVIYSLKKERRSPRVCEHVKNSRLTTLQ